jgi:NCAIR mutase (PurE)-related protein
MTAVFDYQRQERIGLPEAVFCAGKPPTFLTNLLQELREKARPVLLTHLDQSRCDVLPTEVRNAIQYDGISQTGFLNGCHPARDWGTVAVVSAGTSDARVTREAARTLEHAGVVANLIEDVGVAGLWRLQARLPSIRAASVVIAVAGWDAALISVLGGLVSTPLIAVPAGTGYGVAAGGTSALHSILSSCAPGVCTVNIDNGYGAACAALRVLAGIAGVHRVRETPLA